MKSVKNPFTPSFGGEPAYFAGRRDIVENFLFGLENGPGDPNRCTILTGARGTGKTVTLFEIANKAAQIGWISAKATAIPGMLNEILYKIRDAAKDFIDTPSDSKLTSVTIGPISGSRSVESKKKTFGQEFNELLDELNEREIGLLIEIDEVRANLPEFREFAAVFQDVVSTKKDAALLMAGLPHEINGVYTDKSISFLRRARTQRLEAISLSETKVTIRKTVEFAGRSIDKEALEMATNATGGFPYLIQLVGYEIWRQNPTNEVISRQNVVDGIEIAKGFMATSLFELTIQDVSDKDREFLIAMSEESLPVKSAKIADKLGVTTNYASQYRIRLISEGIIFSPSRGYLDFAIPYFVEFIQNRYLDI
ncbi:MAG: ATP-binding protein [Clostridiales Family XIII bacterium]|jgi:hypothetical protein|nr:ATP-binding protein [Clostridiales Family XIII bacterium]